MEPHVRLGLATLTKMAFDGQDLHPLRQDLLQNCAVSAAAAGILMDLSVIDQIHGNPELGLLWQEQALGRARAFSTNRRTGSQIKVLVFAEEGLMGRNTPVEFLLQNAGFEVISYYPDFDSDWQADVPTHDVAFCAVPVDSDAAPAYFANLRAFADQSGVQILNLPLEGFSFDRDVLDQTFPQQPGLRYCKTLRFERNELRELVSRGADRKLLADIAGYPVVIRPVGSHAGQGLEKVASSVEMASYLSRHEDASFYVSEYINYASPVDGAFRKYRIAFVDGRPFAVHMAIASHWDVWYMNANMDQCPGKRDEEAAFMRHFDRDFVPRHQAALEALATAGPEYFGVDCAEDPEGNLVVFEADNALIVHDMDSEDVFPYKAPQMRKVFAAFQAMLTRSSQSRSAWAAKALEMAEF